MKPFTEFPKNGTDYNHFTDCIILMIIFDFKV